MFGPMLIVYFVSIRELGKDDFVSAISFLYVCAVVPWAVSLIALGLLRGPLLIGSLFAVLPVVAGMVIGQQLRKHISENRFQHLMLLILLISGASMLCTVLIRKFTFPHMQVPQAWRQNKIMSIKKYLVTTSVALAMSTMAGYAAAECASDALPASLEAPGGFPERALTMIVPYGPAGGSGQVAQAMAEAVSGLTDVSINRDHKPGGSGTVGMTAYMAAPADGYTVLEHIDDAASAHALDSSKPNPAEALIPLVTSQITFSQIYIREDEDRYTDWNSFVEWVKAQDGKATIANVSKADLF